MPKTAIEYGYPAWIAARARRLRWLRALAHSVWPFALVVILLSLIRGLLGTLPLWIGVLLIPFALATGILMIPWFIVRTAFTWGWIRCPSCDKRFAKKFSPYIPKVCQNCGFNVYTLRHPHSR